MLENTGYIKPIDDLGRVLIPKKVRQRLNLIPGDDLPVYLFTDNKDDSQYICLKVPDKRKDKILIVKDLLKELDIPLPEELDFE